MIAGRPRPSWTRRSPAEVRLLELARTCADEALVYAPGGEVRRALGRAERALRTAACCVHQMDRAA